MTLSGSLRNPAYRPLQVVKLLAARLAPPDLGDAAALLAPPLFDVFEAMPPEDQRHGLEVMRLLRREGGSAEPLLQAGLLHDAGKAGAGVGLLHRVTRVLIARRWRRLWGALASRPTGPLRPFWVMANHPERGAVWLDSLGADPRLVALVRHHESDLPLEWGTLPELAEWHAALQSADARL
jgi:hypothetical protein